MISGRSEELERLAIEMYARGLSTRDIEAAFRDETGTSVLPRSAVSAVTERLWADYQAFAARDLAELNVRSSNTPPGETSLAAVVARRTWYRALGTPYSVLRTSSCDRGVVLHTVCCEIRAASFAPRLLSCLALVQINLVLNTV
ncbi:MAG: transposase [Deltaproteobacteria bacterium]